MEKGSTSGLLNSGTSTPESRRQILELEGMLQKEKAEFEVKPSIVIIKIFNPLFT